MPRRQPSRPSLATDDASQPHHSHDNNAPPAIATITATQASNSKPKKMTPSSRGLSDILGRNPEFADRFFGEPANYQHSLPGGISEADVETNKTVPKSAPNVDNDSSHANGSPTNGNSMMPQNTGNSAITIENTPLNIDGLIIQQLYEDLEAYRYDYEFCRGQLDEGNTTISPAEQRTFQLRLLDLGHQMRMLNHRIQLMQASMNNQRHVAGLVGRAGATTANAYYGAYPPGTTVQPSAYATGASMKGSGQYHMFQANGSGYAGYSVPPQERRGPGRPVGSKNRPRAPIDHTQSPAVAPSGSAKAAALASAGAKRDLPTEIQVATPNDQSAGPTSADPADTATLENPAKRARLDVQVGSPLSNSPEDDNTAPGAHINPSLGEPATDADDANDATEDEIEHARSSFTTVNKKTKSHPSSILAAPSATPSTPIPSLGASRDTSIGGPASPSVGPAGPDSAPRGSTYTRLGHWMCTLCTSQKYLQHPPPKQPSEPSNWPLRDISKIVTHFTRMHTEHNVIERCMELGAALDANRGPLKYWIQVTKKTNIDDAGVNEAVEALTSGRLPDVLRKLSQAANNFPRQD